MSAPTCRTCGAAMLWARVDGRWTALDAARQEPAVGLFAFNPGRRSGLQLRGEHLPHPAWAWAHAGATFHPLHRDVCPGSQAARRRDRRRPGQAALDLTAAELG